MHILENIRLLTIEHTGVNVTEDAVIAWQDGIIVYAGTRQGFSTANAVDVIDGQNQLAAPAFIDCHTHLIFADDRADEFAMRLAGASYQDIALAGGGIVSSVRKTGLASVEDLVAQARPRAQALMREGVATIEIKSGYGLDLANESKMLIAAGALAQELGFALQRTYLGLHALPSSIGRSDPQARQAYISQVIQQDLPALHAQGLVDAVDAFMEGIAFNSEEVSEFFSAARLLGLPVKLHADQLSDTGGAKLAAQFQALSADHLEYTNEQAVQAMAQAGTVAVLLPAAFYCLREKQLPPMAWFRQYGVPMAIATDCNPGTSPIFSIRLAMHLACTLFGMNLTEALLGTTKYAARALGFSDRGELSAGKRADIALWDVKSPAELVYWLGNLSVQKLWVGGAEVKR